MARNNLLKALLLTCLMFFGGLFTNYQGILAQQTTQSQVPTYIKTSDTISVEINSDIPEQLRTNIKDAIVTIYGKDQADEIYSNVVEIINGAKERRSLKLLQEDLNRQSDWYKDEIVYMFYANHFGVKDNTTQNTFNDLIGMLDYLKELGVTTIYILPFMDSPMGDAGFDVRDPKKVMAELGGTEEFDNFIYEARKRGFKVKADLILNHFSDQHEWFQEALKGDMDKLNYFIYLDQPPKYKSYRDEQKGIVVDYTEKDGQISSRRLIFPDITDSHYRKVTINNKDYYLYHTFYPFQLDINWKNPKVLYDVLDIMAFWSNMGIDVFRIDAIPYFIKKEGTTAENLPETHAVVKLLSSYLQAVAPRSILLAEACQWPSDIVPYYGTERTLPPKDLQLSIGKEYNIKVNTEKGLVRTDEVQAGYHFPYMPGIWASLLTENNDHFWKAVAVTPEIPSSATWAMFLRVHDELTLEMIDIPTRKIIYEKLIPNGQEFRKGLGVSGRMSNFLAKDPNRIGLAFSILLSLPGIPIIYYGDEIGAQNNFEYAKKAAEEREIVQRKANKDIKVLSFYDSRDINRGPIPKDEFIAVMNNGDNYKSRIFNTVKTMIRVRKENDAFRRGSFEKVKASKNNILAYLRSKDKQNILVINNLSSKPIVSTLYLDNKTININKTKNFAKDLLSNNQYNYKTVNKGIEVSLKPYQVLWLEL